MSGEGIVSWDFPDEAWLAAEKAADAMAAKYRGSVERDDLYQDALIYMAERPDLVRNRLDKDGADYLAWTLRAHLRNHHEAHAKHQARNARIDDEIGAGRL